MGAAAKAGLGKATVQVDDAKVRITRWDFEPGEATGHHRHEYAYVVVPLVDGIVRVVVGTADTVVPMTAGASYARPAGVEHNVINAGARCLAFVEIEIKG